MVSSKLFYGALAVAALYPQVSAWHNDKVVYDRYGHARMIKQRGPSCKPSNGGAGPTPQPADGADHLPPGSGPTQEVPPSTPPVQGDGPTFTFTATSTASDAASPSASSASSSSSQASSSSSSSSHSASSSALSSSSAHSLSTSTTTSSAAATTTSSSSACPPGSKFATFEDDFVSLLPTVENRRSLLRQFAYSTPSTSPSGRTSWVTMSRSRSGLQV